MELGDMDPLERASRLTISNLIVSLGESRMRPWDAFGAERDAIAKRESG